MLVIRFSRVGKKGHAQYKVVLAENTYPVQGKFIEQLGSYDPHSKQAVLKQEKIKYWIEKGATCSDSAYNLFVRNSIIEGKKRPVKVPKKPTPEVATDAAPEAAPKAAVEAEAKPAAK